MARDVRRDDRLFVGRSARRTDLLPCEMERADRLRRDRGIGHVSVVLCVVLIHRPIGERRRRRRCRRWARRWSRRGSRAGPGIPRERVDLRRRQDRALPVAGLVERCVRWFVSHTAEHDGLSRRNVRCGQRLRLTRRRRAAADAQRRNVTRRVVRQRHACGRIERKGNVSERSAPASITHVHVESVR